MTAQKNSAAFDFDAWYAEEAGATIPFKLLGRDWELPGDIPAATILKFNRIERWVKSVAVEYAIADAEDRAPEPIPLPDGLTEVDMVGSFEGMCREMIGDVLVDEWFELGISQKMLQAVSRRLYAIYSNQDPDEAMGLGKAPKTSVKQPQDRKRKSTSSGSSAG